MKKFLLLFTTIYANAHFLTMIPTTDNINEINAKKFQIESMFIHPFEQSGMNMEKPIGIFEDNKKESLKLEEIKRFENKAWKTTYIFKKPSLMQFYTVPEPYFEASEEKFISHIPKVIVSAFGFEDGWDKPIGLKYEIIPMVKPFGLYVGNLFQGKVLHNKKPASNIKVEVELYNEFGLKAPTDAHITQVVKTDENGVFSFVLNHKGWWGFAGLIEEGEKEHKGKKYPIENGALIWIKAY